MSERVPVPERHDLDALAELDAGGVDWGGARRATYLVHQWARYEYSGPVRELRQRLVVCPPARCR